MREFNVLRIMDLVESFKDDTKGDEEESAEDVNQKSGEDAVKEILSAFSCEYKNGLRNSEVEYFLQKNSIEFSKRKMSITYLVMDEQYNTVGYFTLTHKPITVCSDVLVSATIRKKMARYAKFDKRLDAYIVSAFLIAQFGKNYNLPFEEQISGEDLMDLTLSLIEDIQQQIGGGVVFLECEDKPKLIEFYTKKPNSFFYCNERYSETDGIKYVQLMRFI